MEQLTPKHSCDLTDRVLWFDGISTPKPEGIFDAVYHQFIHGGELFVSDLSPEIRAYNRLASEDQQINVRSGNGTPPAAVWPEQIEQVDVFETVSMRLSAWLRENNIEEQDLYVQRVDRELALYDQKGLFPVLRACIFVINTLSAHNAVWGVGRGSAVASFVLYLIGVHDVNSVKYNLDITEFLGDH